MRSLRIALVGLLFAVASLGGLPVSSLSAQTLQRVAPRPIPNTMPTPHQGNQPATVQPPLHGMQLDYPKLYREEQEKNRQLSAENVSLQQRIAQMSHPGGRLVKAYCESDAVSRNTAGARNNCSASGYSCEPVSGLCRASCQGSSMCATGYICDTYNDHCVKP